MAAKKVAPPSLLKYQDTFNEAKKHNAEVEKHVKRAMDDLNPLRVLNLFKMISPSDCELLGINPAEGRPEMFLWQYVPAPPICIRPSVAQDNASTEDDLTTKLADIIQTSSLIRSALQKGQAIQTIMDQWDYLQNSIALYVNSDVPGLQQNMNAKPIRGFCQRLKGKQGRFRGNLSGKRVDFSGRTVISPDPNLSVEEVAVPELVAKNLTYPERVTQYNLDKLKNLVLNGPDIYPGAKTVHKKDGLPFNLKFGKRDKTADRLNIGDVVDRHLEDGDIVLFNRQPSLHKLSIMSHKVKVRPWRTFRLNECVCNPYNADFDGDEMNLHVPQTEEARTEAIQLMGVKYNLSTPKNGEPIIAAIQDFITAAYLLSSKENFFDRKTFSNICMYMFNASEQLDLPPPAIIKPQALWTGKQVFSMLIRPNKKSPVRINHEAKGRSFKQPEKGIANDLCENDGWLVIRDSEVMCGRMDKSLVGEGKKASVFYIINRDFGPDQAVEAMNRLAKLSARWLTNAAFSIGINDVYADQSIRQSKEDLVGAAYKTTEDDIKKYNMNALEKQAGCTMEVTLENVLSATLNEVREKAGTFCTKNLSKRNAALVMATSGSKGSNLNVAQMVSLVGQQIIGGERVPDGFQDRSLPHFPKNAKQPASKGFVKNSFFSGLSPTEFIFHGMSGREGLVDTAVKTAETGYMSRRLMKSLEDLSTQYDDTVRNSSSGIVQFQFGADKLDPLAMEGSAVPVDFPRTWLHAENITWDNDDEALLPYEITFHCDRLLADQKEKYTRRGLLHDEILDYDDHTDYAVDEWDSARDFISTITRHVGGLTASIVKMRKSVNLPGLEIHPQESGIFYDARNEDPELQRYLNRVAKISLRTLEMFVQLCLEKYAKAQVEPGHAVGAVGAQSIGEPGTQMTLKTFHFAGVAGMSMTQGVPRIKEIINASKVISTPVITCPLERDEESQSFAEVVKAKIEKTHLGDILESIEDIWSARRATVRLHFDDELMDREKSSVTMEDIASAILRNKKLKIRNNDVYCWRNTVSVYVTNDSLAALVPRGAAAKKAGADQFGDLLLRVNTLKRALPEVHISGYADAARALIQKTAMTNAEIKAKDAMFPPTAPLEPGKKRMKHTILVEGYGLRACMTTDGVLGTKCRSNSIMECRDVLGIEAARTTVAAEIGEVMKTMNIDPRHMQLLADVMTYKGEVLGITRFGLSKMRDSVLQLASFEKTPDHLFEAAANMKADQIEGVSECIIMGQTMSVGTGAFKVVKLLGLQPETFKQRTTAFEDAWKADLAQRKKAGGALRATAMVH